MEGQRPRGETLRVWSHCKGLGFVSEGNEDRRKFCSEKRLHLTHVLIGSSGCGADSRVQVDKGKQGPI